MNIRLVMILILIISSFSMSFAQDDVYLDMSLEELFDLDIIVSASKRPEDLFEAPLSVTIIKREDILRAGSTCIPEALRLAPGLIVREQTPGNYDVHIRGFDDVTTSLVLPLPMNSIILVMIDNRIVYDYFSGGTFWETLPIDLGDVERIEVVRGPASALYGPNAAQGVINIITRRPEEEGFSIYTNAAVGNQHTSIANASILYNWEDKFSFGLSTNHMYRNRFEDKYYSWRQQEYVPFLDIIPLDGELKEDGTFERYWEHMEPRYKDLDRAINRGSINTFFRCNFSEESHLTVTNGIQYSDAQKAYYTTFATPLSDYNSKSLFSDIEGKYKNLYARATYTDGRRYTSLVWNEYEYEIIDAVLEYQWQLGKFSFRPGINYREADYKGILITDGNVLENIDGGFHYIPHNSRIISAHAFSLLSEYQPSSKLRLIYGLRTDNYNINDNLSFTYEAALTYRFNKNNMGRLVISKANRAPFMMDTYLGDSVGSQFPLFDENGLFKGVQMIQYEANKNLDYLTVYTTELGWRTKLLPNLKLDLELFAAGLADFITLKIVRSHKTVIEVQPGYDVTLYQQHWKSSNIKTYIAWQHGLGFDLEYEPSDQFKCRVYGTFQHTEIEHDMEKLKDEIRNTPEVFGTDITEDEIDSLAIVLKNQTFTTSTPHFFGGLWINYTPTPKLNLNATAYYTEEQAFYGCGVTERGYHPKVIRQEIDPKVLLNTKISYEFWKNIKGYFSIRNITGVPREYGFTDEIGTLYLIGFQMGD